MSKTSSPPKNFESALAELEKVAAQMESGKLGLEESLAAYQRGAELLDFCRKVLEDTEQKVRILENGVLKPFLHEQGEDS